MALVVQGSGRPLAEVAADLSGSDKSKCLYALAELGSAGDAGAPYFDQVLKLAKGKADHLDVKTSAMQALALCAKGKEKEATKVFEEGLGSGTPEVRTASAAGLGVLKVTSSSKDLAGLLQDSYMRVRCAAMGALAQIGEGSASHAKVMAEQLNVPIVRRDAIFALGAAGKAGADYLDDIVGFIEDSDPEVRLAVAEALWGLQQWVTPQMAEKVGKLLQHQDDRMRASGASALGGIGSPQKVANFIPALVKMMRECPPTREKMVHSPNCAAALALGRLGVQDDDIAFYLTSKMPGMRAAACEGLASMGTKASKHKAAVERLLKDEHEGVCEAAERALKSL
mmetsp:Transcript_110276/g.235522  ORF Transcript_110276/g.235522 Transcript_110276/m.235522 type:complete len:340 (-) Transcript_110276:131-1150(-)